MPSSTINDELLDWANIEQKYTRKASNGLLLGNGASLAIWDKFSYRSLFEIASDPSQGEHLHPKDIAIFNDMETTNFEGVLSSLAIARMVCIHLGKDYTDIDERYSSIRNALRSAILAVHLPYDKLSDAVKRSIRRDYELYRYIYTTNYDLLPYWVSMLDGSYHKIKDYMWCGSGRFDLEDTNEWASCSFLLYLHGALHLFHNVSGDTRKIVRGEDYGNILSQLNGNYDDIPLFVSEGTAKEKLKAIRRNEYLDFAYWKLRYHRGPMVVFGSSLSKEHDQHIIDAMRHWAEYDKIREKHQPRPLAVSVHPSTSSNDRIELKNRLVTQLNKCAIDFFDSTTHPLGSPSLKGPPAER